MGRQYGKLSGPQIEDIYGISFTEGIFEKGFSSPEELETLADNLLLLYRCRLPGCTARNEGVTRDNTNLVMHKV